MVKHVCLVVVFSVLILSGPISRAEQFQIVAWNVESGGITRSKIGEQLRGFTGVHLWALSEVQASNADFFIASAGEGEKEEYSGVIGNSGGADRLLVIFDESRFDLVEAFELEDLALGGRAPLVARLRTRNDRVEFLFVAVHLHRRNATKCLEQSRELRDWAAQVSLPVIAAGDCNFDYEVPAGPGNTAFDEFGLGGVFQWEQPAMLIATQYSDSDGDGENDHDSVLDFIWSAGGAQAWGIESKIIVRPDDFPDDERTSDHRPLMALVDTAAVEPMAELPRRKLQIAVGRSTNHLLERGELNFRQPWRGADARETVHAETYELASRPEDFGHFEGRVAAIWDEEGRDMTLIEDFHFVDLHQQKWTASRDSVVNGASIPRAFWSVIGGPFEGRYRNASVIHDVYCDTQERPWRDVHRMFYEACRCGGAGVMQSKLMYYAVYHFGPRWGDSPTVLSEKATSSLEESEVAALRAYIEWQDPSLEELEALPPVMFDHQQ